MLTNTVSTDCDTDMIQLNHEQQQALQAMLNGENIFLTGEAGSGKSTVVQAFRELRHGTIAVLAPTGIAALNIGGSSIHSFFRLPPRFLLPDEIPDLGPDFQRTLAATDTIIIDEISMCRADLFNAIGNICRKTAPMHLHDQPFGGKQVICVGDFHQLPPVIASGQEYQLLQEHHHGAVYAFETDTWRTAGFCPIRLRTVHRQWTDPGFSEALHALRQPMHWGFGGTENAVNWINERALICSTPADTLCLCTTNLQADTINSIGESCILGPAYRFEASLSGSFPADTFPTQQFLDLKVGSRVMLLANNWSWPDGRHHVNGDLGHIQEIEADTAVLVVLDDGRSGWVHYRNWHNVVYRVQFNPITGKDEIVETVIGTFTQLPLRLAHAVTIHKSQGLTLDRAHIVLGNRGTFAAGQLYTALSRCRSMRGLSFDRPIRPDDVIIDPRVCEFEMNLGSGVAAAGY